MPLPHQHSTAPTSQPKAILSVFPAQFLLSLNAWFSSSLSELFPWPVKLCASKGVTGPDHMEPIHLHTQRTQRLHVVSNLERKRKRRKHDQKHSASFSKTYSQKHCRMMSDPPLLANNSCIKIPRVLRLTQTPVLSRKHRVLRLSSVPFFGPTSDPRKTVLKLSVGSQSSCSGSWIQRSELQPLVPAKSKKHHIVLVETHHQ